MSLTSFCTRSLSTWPWAEEDKDTKAATPRETVPSSFMVVLCCRGSDALVVVVVVDGFHTHADRFCLSCRGPLFCACVCVWGGGGGEGR